jgi:hypothetical protein
MGTFINLIISSVEGGWRANRGRGRQVGSVEEGGRE